MSKVDQQQLSEWCERIYSREGQSAVFDYILEYYPQQKWDDCQPCEIKSPVTEEDDSSCLVCGSLIR